MSKTFESRFSLTKNEKNKVKNNYCQLLNKNSAYLIVEYNS